MSHLRTAAVRTRFVYVLVLSASFALSSSLTPVSATQVTAGKFVFDRAPRLVKVLTTQLASFVSGGKYQLTLTVPQDAGAPLQAVSISQAENAAEIGFALNQTQAVANSVVVPVSVIEGASRADLTIAFELSNLSGDSQTATRRKNFE